MITQYLIEATQKPEIYSPGTKMMWTDEYISTQLLEIHLDENVDLASRKGSTISSTVSWIMDKTGKTDLDILDLGCGPGLYAEKFAIKGYNVTGVDISSYSIDYAKKSAQSKNLDISYINTDYLNLEDTNKYDVILMIFTDFGVLSPDQRSILLAKVHKALKPGGKFIFDILNENFPIQQFSTKDWEITNKGFWGNSPYLSLSQSFYYEEEKVLLSQHIIITQEGNPEIYRFWIHTFCNEDITHILSEKKFCNIRCFNNIIPDSDLYKSDAVTFCIAEK